MFNKNNFCHIASNNRNEKKAGVFVYKTSDTLETVLTSGYFNDKIVDINLHDLIIHEWHNPADRTKVQKNVLCVVERTLDNVGTTLIKSKWEEDTQETIDTLSDDVETIKEDITDIKEKDIEQDGRLDDIEDNVAYKATDFETPITSTNKGITQTEETALNNKIDLAANSGRMITAQGLWYAKMYAATVAPAADDDTNYADFSQTDGQGNPIIVTYTRTNGAWVQDQIITPPADYDGYVPITSKIWDIPEQAGQQGGRILWNHQSKEFTPYPQIISFENINVTGDSNVTMPQNPGLGQIVNKQYVDNALVNHGTGRNVGDIFFTSRTDNTLNGAVDCNGAQYNTTDFTGAQTIGQLLADGKVPYVSLADYATALETDGSVGAFGWDGAGTTTFRVPSLNDIFVETGTVAQIGDFVPAGAPNITGKFSVTNAASGPKGNINATDGCVYADGTTSGSYSTFAGDGNSATGPKVAHIDASRSSSVYGNSQTIQPNSVRYRAMVQLATSATDEAVETCTSVLADVAALKYDYVVDFQAPTAANNYTWYRKYKSGWVEQGGITSTSGTQTLPVTMADTNYIVMRTNGKGRSGTGANEKYTSVGTRTVTTIVLDLDSNIAPVFWEVKGMAA